MHTAGDYLVKTCIFMFNPNVFDFFKKYMAKYYEIKYYVFWLEKTSITYRSNRARISKMNELMEYRKN